MGIFHLKEDTLYCYSCDKIVGDTVCCPFCGKHTVDYRVWAKGTKEQREKWISDLAKYSISPDRYTDEDRKKAEEFDRKHHAELDEELKKAEAERESRKQYVPKCPTCGCPDIEKISASAKATDVALFGLWGSRKRKLQFRCKNCGYEW